LRLTSAGAVEHGLDGAEFLDQLDAAFVADAGRAGNVVDRVAAQGHHVDDFVGRDAEDVSVTLAGSRIRLSFCGLRIFTCGRDELHHVLVAGDDEDLVLAARRLRGEGADDVVGLEALG
jgi:hypothetical protein